MEYIIISGILRKYILEFFTSEAISYINNSTFLGDGWEVEIKEQSFVGKGIVKIPQTKVIFRLKDKDSFAIVDKFRLKFLSAGG